MARVFSGIQPTGELHLGNLLGAVNNWVRDLDAEDSDDAVYCVVDLHALTIPKDPEELREKTLELTQLLIACGLDPQRCTLFVQSHVRAHAEMGWLMQCVTSYGELSRMTQFKDKRDRAEFVSGGLFAYPALQVADIVLYDTDKVPVGDDQRQHVELCRDVAERFNSRYGQTLVVPEHVIPAAGARVMDLQQPESKMSKSLDSPAGTVGVLDAPDAVARKFKRAVTDSDGEVRYDPDKKPGVSNLLSILAAATGGNPEMLASEFSQYGPLKAAAGDAVVALLEPIQSRFAELRSDPAETERLLALGAEKARDVAEVVLDRTRAALGLTPRP